MTNHIHLLLERQQETVGGTMQRVLGGYSRYYNRRHKHSGHVFQGRHRSIHTGLWPPTRIADRSPYLRAGY
ncbi:MAG: hypothetical protein AB7V18_03335 [Pyrinomonadaceae bacterium]